MGKLIITNVKDYSERLKQEYKDFGFEIFSDTYQRDVFITTFKKKRVDTYNYLESDGISIAVTGTFIYNKSIGKEALEIVIKNLSEGKSVQDIRDEAIGSYAMAVCKDDEITIFLDAVGTYNLFYNISEGKYLITNTWYQIQECVHKTLNQMAFIEMGVFESDHNNETPWNDIFRLMGNEIMIIDHNRVKIRKVKYVNTYQYKGTQAAIDDLYKAVCKVAGSTVKVVDSPVVSITGGMDSRFVLASFASQGIIPKLFYWFGNDAVSNINECDIRAGEKLATIFNTDFTLMNVSINSIVNYKKINKEFIQKYGDYAHVYGANQRWFDIFEKRLDADFFILGNWGEILTDWDNIEALYEPNMSVREFMTKIYFERHRQFKAVKEHNKFVDYMVNKFERIAEDNDISTKMLTKEECMFLFHYNRWHGYGRVAEIVNTYMYNYTLFTQKPIYDIIRKLPFSDLNSAHVYLEVIKKLDYHCLIPDFYPHCSKRAIDQKNMVMYIPKFDQERLVQSMRNNILHVIEKVFGNKGQIKFRNAYHKFMGHKDAARERYKVNSEIELFSKSELKKYRDILPVIWNEDGKCVAQLVFYPAIECKVIKTLM